MSSKNNATPHTIRCVNAGCEREFVSRSPNWKNAKRCPTCRKVFENLRNRVYKINRKTMRYFDRTRKNKPVAVAVDKSNPIGQ